ncbi:MAG TPA: hypothetical protein VFX02_07985 [Gammaproteobacteria bacterium]|nr:hypothetical protein [Gammaproteobacteria bacterium]
MGENSPPADLDLPPTEGAWIECQLGITDRKFEIESRDELRMISQHMAAQARQSLYIYTRDLDPKLYDTEAFIETLSRLARRSKYCFIQILLLDSDSVVKNGHRLIPLQQRLDTYIKIRKVDEKYKDYVSAFMVADDRGVIFRQFGDRHEAEVNYNDPSQAGNLLKQFTEIWEMSAPDPQLRQLYL